MEPPAAANPPAVARVQRANVRLLIAMIVFALALTAVVLLWMYGRMKRQQESERVSPPVGSQAHFPGTPEVASR